MEQRIKPIQINTAKTLNLIKNEEDEARIKIEKIQIESKKRLK